MSRNYDLYIFYFYFKKIKYTLNLLEYLAHSSLHYLSLPIYITLTFLVLNFFIENPYKETFI